MAAGAIPPPERYTSAESWDDWLETFEDWSLATGQAAKSEAVQVATLKSCIGGDAWKIFSTFDFDSADDRKKIAPVKAKYKAYFEPKRNITFERYKFRGMTQDRARVDEWVTDLRRQAARCDYGTLCNSVIRDQMVYGCADDKCRERMLRDTTLTLERAIEILRSAEMTSSQLKTMGSIPSEAVHFKKEKAVKDAAIVDSASRPTVECRNCGHKHFTERGNCPAENRECWKCGKRGHFSSKCYRKAKPSKGRKVTEKTHRVSDTSDSDEVVNALTEKVNRLRTSESNKALVTFMLSGRAVKFQIDTGSTCNVLPFHLYAQITGDRNGRKLKPGHTLVQHNLQEEKAKGKAMLNIEREGKEATLLFQIVEGPVQPLLSLAASERLGLVRIMASDTIHQVVHANLQVEDDPILKEYQDVFTGLGRLPEKHHISVDKTVRPVVHAPRKVPVAIRDTLEMELNRLESEQIIAKVTEPTPWVSSMVVVPKPDGMLRICLDPRDLNKAVLREHYPSKTIEEVATRLTGARIFSVLDAKSGFNQVVLDFESSLLTTFNTPFGRYRWKRLPFGINSAPEIWQRTVNEIVEGLPGIEVIADDFLVIGFGETDEEATKSHDEHLRQLLERFRQKCLTLNRKKVQLRKKCVPYMGHLLTAQGVAVDPKKIAAITQMEAPTDVTGLKRFLGMVNYLAKFMPHLSQDCEVLRQLDRKEVEWDWSPNHQLAFEKIKEKLTQTPVLRYYDLKKEVTIQCDASQDGLGAALLQEGQPVAYVSRALTSAESRYAQIEKELLAVVFSCEKFETYIFGREVTVDSDHKPLEMIWQKPIHAAPKRLQRMLLRLQKFDIKIRYKKGSQMYLADTLSRAYLQAEELSDFCHALTEVDQKQNVAVGDVLLQEIKEATCKDPTSKELKNIVLTGWPASSKQTPKESRAYFGCRENLTVEGDLLMKGETVVVPKELRAQVLKKIHDPAHMGIEACLRRARQIFYWPGMAKEMHDYVMTCSVCQRNRPRQQKEPMQPHRVPDAPWQVVATDLFVFENRDYIVITDYFSNYFVLDRLVRTRTRDVIDKMKKAFARFGIPEKVISDNGPCFASEEFKNFARQWNFELVTSSPLYPQSNGKAESSVKRCKTLMKKAADAGNDPYLALLEFRNTPSESTGTSPSEKMFGRRQRTLLPRVSHPRQALDTRSMLLKTKERQKRYYDRGSKPLPPLRSGDAVRMRRPGDSDWSLGHCLRAVGNRQYDVEVAGRQYRRNRRDLRATQETRPTLDGGQALPEDVSEAVTDSSGVPTLTLPLDTGPVGAGVAIDGLYQSCASSPVEASPIEASPPSPVVAPDVGKRHSARVRQSEASPPSPVVAPVVGKRRSARVRKTPSWMKDYVMG